MKKKSQMHTSREIVNLIAKFIIEYSIRKCMAASGVRQPRKKHYPKFQKLIFQKCVQNLQNLYLELS